MIQKIREIKLVFLGFEYEYWDFSKRSAPGE